MPEHCFLAELAERTGCGVLLDVNNLFVDAANLGVDPARWLAAIPPEAVGYLHLAGHAVLPDVRIDTHGTDVPDPVWALYETAPRRFPQAERVQALTRIVVCNDAPLRMRETSSRKRRHLVDE